MSVTFKPGDRATCLDGAFSPLEEGRVYTVTGTDVGFITVDFIAGWNCESRFVLAPPLEQPKLTFGERPTDPDPRHFAQLAAANRYTGSAAETSAILAMGAGRGTISPADSPFMREGNAKTSSTNPKDLIGITKVQVGLFPSAAIIEGAEAMTDGLKYGAYNWREHPVLMTIYLDAMQRHLMCLRDGEDDAEDSKVSHIGHILGCAAIIADAKACGNLIDDRPHKGAASALLAKYKKEKPE